MDHEGVFPGRGPGSWLHTRAFRPRQGCLVLAVSGEIDGVSFPEFEKRLFTVIRAWRVSRVVVDLTYARFMSVQGMNLLREVADGRLCVVLRDNHVRRLARAAGLTDRAREYRDPSMAVWHGQPMESTNRGHTFLLRALDDIDRSLDALTRPTAADLARVVSMVELALVGATAMNTPSVFGHPLNREIQAGLGLLTRGHFTAARTVFAAAREADVSASLH
ncbi:STAS domain-containing protein [Actinokineospora enzanensis]|uniref:STAS domain-containing protein n=1 Tax=Actinokineospora enzanensis TaxID=155975 RepID=UPI00036BA850|nr:STAS domain-containing protein [Actinokineospora enzanensis]